MPATHTRELPYREDSADLMRAIGEFAMPACLDSARHGGANARQDILAAEPIAFLRIENGEFSCSQNVSRHLDSFIDSKNILLSIRMLRDMFLAISDKNADPSPTGENRGAVIGYLGYPTLTDKAAFAVNDAFVGVYLWTVIVDHDRGTACLRFHESCTEDYMDAVSARVSGAVQDARTAADGALRLEAPFVPLSTFSDYSSAFLDIKSRIDRGDCYQVNLTQCFRARASGTPMEAYLKLRGATAAPFSAYIDWGDGALLSLSPERFVRLRGREVLTQPVKGTRPRGASEADDAELAQELASSEKDTAENLMIVDLLRNDLGRVCETGTVHAKQLFTIESYSNVHHMVSNVTGTLRAELDAMDLLGSCYPGGSITGAPKLHAMQVIQALEQAPRRAYCGTAFCWGSEGNFDSSITIRSLLWGATELLCWAGGGIVADSDCAQEYQECFDKIGNILKALQE